MIRLEIRKVQPSDREWVDHMIVEHWGANVVVSRRTIHEPSKLDGYIALQDKCRVGLITYRIEAERCEIVTLNSLNGNKGIGSGLIRVVHNNAIEKGCHRLWLVTTNDNYPALGFYQRRGFRIVAWRQNEIESARLLKPEIPQTGIDGILITDEIELSLDLL